MMTGLKLQPNCILVLGSLLGTGLVTTSEDFVPGALNIGVDITQDYLERVHAQGFKVLAVEEEAFNRAKQQEGNLLDPEKWRGMRIEKVLGFSDVLTLAFGTM